jgi:hypothetical protein
LITLRSVFRNMNGGWGWKNGIYLLKVNQSIAILTQQLYIHFL